MAMQKYVRVAAGFLVLAVFGIAAASAAGFSVNPMRMVIPYPPGGPTDIAARFIAQGIEEKLRQPVVTENKPGASGVIGLESVAQALPDGYTLGLAPSPMASYQALIKEYKANLL